MPLLPGIADVFTAMISAPPLSGDEPPAEARAQMHAMIDASFGALAVDRPPVASEVDHRIPVAGGEITVRFYRPESADPLPCHVYLHGGGFWLGTLDQGDARCRGMVIDAGCAVASVDYRLAPEHRFPTAAEDAYAAFQWVVDHADELGIDASRVSVGGGSSGGNLAAVVSLMARDRGGPRPVLQVLEIPVMDLTRDDPLVFPDEDLVVHSGKTHYGSYYLADPADARNPYASPLLADDLTDLPAALVMCAEYDPLCTEGMAYAQRLAEAGVPVESRMWEGQFHGSQAMAKLIPDEAAEFNAMVVAALRRAYGTT